MTSLVFSLEFDGSREKAFAHLTSVLDDEITVKLPAVLVHLASENYLKNEEFDISDLMHEIDQAFAVFAAIKRAVGLTRNRNTQTYTICPSTQLTRRYTGFGSNRKETVKFGIAIPEGARGCHRSLDSVLGNRWDVLPASTEGALDLVVKTMRFTEHRDFGLFSLRCMINATEGRYHSETNYRTLVRNNLGEASAADYTNN